MTRAILDAAYNVAHDYPGGAESLAPRLGKLGTSLCHELTATGSAKLGLTDAVKITDFTGDLRILQAWATHAGQMLVALPALLDDRAQDALLRSLPVMAKKFSDVITEVTDDLADGDISDNDLARIERVAGELVATIHHMLQVARERNQAAKPAHEKAGDAQAR